MSDLSDILTSINLTKEDLMDKDRADKDRWLKSYVPYVVNHCLMPHPDTIFWANELNQRPFMDKDMQYRTLLHVITKKKRFAPWLKNKQADQETIDLVKEYYGYSNKKAREILPLLTEEDILMMKNGLTKGGRVR